MPKCPILPISVLPFHFNVIQSMDRSPTNSMNSQSPGSTVTIHWKADVFPFHRLILLLTFSLLKDDIIRVAVIFYIVRSTDDCHFKEHVGTLIILVAISQILTFPLLAYISDFNSKHVSTVVMITAVLELVIELFMAFGTSHNVGMVYFLFALRQLIRTTNTSSNFKLLKVKLLCWLRTSYSNSMEQRYFQTMFSENEVNLKNVVNFRGFSSKCKVTTA